MVFSKIRFVNACLLALAILLTMTGVYGLFWTLNGFLWDIHRIAGWALIAAAPAKIAISYRSLRRRLPRPAERPGTAISLLLAVVTLAVIALGLLWDGRLGPESYPLRQTAISWHWMLSLGLLLPFFVHVYQRWPRPRRADLLSRRAGLRLIGLGAAALAGWRIMEQAASAREGEGSLPRPSGSRRAAAFTANRFPVTHNREARPVDLAEWRLELWGVKSPRNYTYKELLDLPQSETIASLDCTLGWYTIQKWQGIALASLLDAAGVQIDQPARELGVRLESTTGYTHFLPLAEARLVILATHVGEEILEHLHGFPLRAVVPTRRGWFWVKWLRKIEVVSL